MYSIRLFAVRHARLFESLYSGFESFFLRLDPLLSAIGYNRLEKPVVFVERHVKGILFDCKMCGQCILSSTGMSCPMNCPKNLRNGPCGGVRPDAFPLARKVAAVLRIGNLGAPKVNDRN